MLRSLILACFFAAATSAARVAKDSFERESEVVAQVSNFVPGQLPTWPRPAAMPRMPAVMSRSPDMPVGGTPQNVSHAGVGRRDLSPWISMQRPEYLPDLHKDLGSAFFLEELEFFSNEDDEDFEYFDDGKGNIWHHNLFVEIEGKDVGLYDPMQDPLRDLGLPHDWLIATDWPTSHAPVTPAKYILNVGNMIEDWPEHALEQANNDTVNAREAQNFIDFFLRWLSPAKPNFHVFALAAQWPSIDKLHQVAYDRIKAIAIVQFQSVRHTHRRFKPFGVVHIAALASKSSNGNVGSGEGVIGIVDRKLLSEIIDWARLQGKLVTATAANTEMEKSYVELGFMRMPRIFGDQMFYIGDRDAELLRTDDPATGDLLMELVPPQITADGGPNPYLDPYLASNDST